MDAGWPHWQASARVFYPITYCLMEGVLFLSIELLTGQLDADIWIDIGKFFLRSHLWSLG